MDGTDWEQLERDTRLSPAEQTLLDAIRARRADPNDETERAYRDASEALFD
jgi:hypothetical protein